MNATSGGQERTHAQLSTYVGVQIASIVLTVIAFYGVVTHWPGSIALPIILALAAIQLGLQAVLFMHLNRGRRAYSLFFTMGLFLAALVGISLAILLNVHIAGTGTLPPAALHMPGGFASPPSAVS